MKKKRTCVTRFFAVLLVALLLCMQFLPASAVGEEEERSVMLSLYTALEVAYGVTGDILSSYGGPETYGFSGSVNEDNIDRIAGTALMLDMSFHPEVYAEYLAVGALPGSLMESAITTYFDVDNVDLSQSKNYDRGLDTYFVTDLVTEPEDSYYPFCVLQDQFSFQYDISESGTVTLDGVYMGIDRFATGRLVFKIMLDVSGITIYSVDLTPTELLTLKDTSSLEIENYTHYLRGVRADTSVGTVEAMFEVPVYEMKVISGYYAETDADTLAGTGSGVCLFDEYGDIVDCLELVVLGDVNGDGTLSSADYMQIKNAFAGEFYLDGACFEAADTNGDGELGTADYMRLRKHLAQEIDIYA